MYGSYSLMANVKANALAVLAATLNLPADNNYHLMVATHHLFCLKYDLEVSEVHTISTDFKLRDWRFSIIDYVLHDILFDDPRDVVSVRRRSTRFYDDAVIKTLYRHSYGGILLRCLSSSEAQEVIKEAHDGICGAYQPDLKLKDRLH